MTKKQRSARCLPLLVHGGHLEPLVGAGIVGMRSGDLLASDPVPAHYEEVVVQDGRPVTSDIDQVGRKIVCQWEPTFSHLLIPEHGRGLPLVGVRGQGSPQEIPQGHQDRSPSHPSLSQPLLQGDIPWSLSRRPQKVELGLAQHLMEVDDHEAQAGLLQVGQPIHLRQAVQLQAVSEPHLGQQQLQQGRDLQEGGRFHQLGQQAHLVHLLLLRRSPAFLSARAQEPAFAGPAGIDEVEHQAQARGAEAAQLLHFGAAGLLAQGLAHAGAVEGAEVVALLDELPLAHRVAAVLQADLHHLLRRHGWGPGGCGGARQLCALASQRTRSPGSGCGASAAGAGRRRPAKGRPLPPALARPVWVAAAAPGATPPPGPRRGGSALLPQRGGPALLILLSSRKGPARRGPRSREGIPAPSLQPAACSLLPRRTSHFRPQDPCRPSDLPTGSGFRGGLGGCGPPRPRRREAGRREAGRRGPAASPTRRAERLCSLPGSAARLARDRRPEEASLLFLPRSFTRGEGKRQ